VNLASLASARPRPSGADTLLDEAVRFYLRLVERAATTGTPAEARNVLETMARVRLICQG